MRLKIFLIGSFVSVSVLSSFAQEPTLSTLLSRDSIMIGEQVEWSFKVTAPKTAYIAFAQVDSIGNRLIEVLKTTGPDTMAQTATDVTVKLMLLLTSFDAGIYELPPVPLLVVHNNNNLIDTLYFNSVTLKVNTVAVDTTGFLQSDKMGDIKPPIKYPYTLAEIIWPWGIIALAACLLLAAVVYVILRIRKKQPVFGRAKPVEPPHIVALRELKKIRAEKLWQNNKVKLYYTRVTDVLRLYLEQRYAIQASEQTSEEILIALAQLPLPEYFMPKIRDFLSTSDLVKFAKYLPVMEENENAVMLIEQFVSETTAANIEEIRSGNTTVNDSKSNINN